MPALSGSHRRTRVSIELWGGLVAFLLLGICAWLGAVNGDEGWYVVASRLALHGSLPYRDFSFTQGPLILYALAPLQALVPGLAAARVTSVLLGTATVVLSLRTTRRLASPGAGAATGLMLLVGFPALWYVLSITKTYALSAFCVSVVLAALTSTAAPSRRLPIAALAAVGFALTRSTGVGLAALVVIYCLRVADVRRTRVFVVLAAGLPALAFAALAASDLGRTRWNLFSYHQLAWMGESHHVAKYAQRLFSYVTAWPGYAVLAAVAYIAVVADPEVRAWLRAHAELLVVAAGLAIFLVLNVAGGAFFAKEYAVPAIPAGVTIAILILSRVTREPLSLPHIRAIGVAAIVILAVIAGIGADYFGRPGWAGAPSATAAVTRCVTEHSRPGDRVFALLLTEVVANARRRPVDGATLGIFSYQDVTTARARDLHLLNAELVARTIERKVPSVVVLTDVDNEILTRPGYFTTDKIGDRAFEDALRIGYTPVCTSTVIRQSPNEHIKVTVYARRP